MINIKVCRVLVKYEAAGTTRRKSDRPLQVSVVLHVPLAEDGIAVIWFLKWYFRAQQRIREEVEIIAVCAFVIDAAVALVSIQVDQVCVISTIVESIRGARVTLPEQVRNMSTLYWVHFGSQKQYAKLEKCLCFQSSRLLLHRSYLILSHMRIHFWNYYLRDLDQFVIHLYWLWFSVSVQL